MTPIRRRKLLFSYLPDWILTLVLAGIFFALDKVPGFKRSFSINDPTIHFTFAEHERVPDLALYMIAVVAPFVLQALVNLVTIRSWWDFHNGSLGLILGLSLTGAVTQFTKITVGRPRPDVLDRCQPPPGVVDPPYGLSTVDICTSTDVAKLRDGFRSFPSGHSSLSFAGLGFLAFYLAGKLHLFDRRGHAGKAWISLFPLAGAALVAISRTMDYRRSPYSLHRLPLCLILIWQITGKTSS
jgi:diacylglycerol diphosphate phosphatase/phosphatidate phosphatase